MSKTPTAKAPDRPPPPWPEDALIRLSGFAIHARPIDGPVLWVRDGRTYTHAEAFALARREQREREEQKAG